MSAKLKILVILVLSIFATAAAGVYITNRQQSAPISTNGNGQQQHFSAAVSVQELVANPQRANYKTIPLDRIKSALQGTDPAALALDAFDTIESEQRTRKVEVFYPQPNQALVTITQFKVIKDTTDPVKYRVELATLGRSLLVSSPSLWQIVWVGSQEKCFSTEAKQNLVMAICQ